MHLVSNENLFLQEENEKLKKAMDSGGMIEGSAGMSPEGLYTSNIG